MKMEKNHFNNFYNYLNSTFLFFSFKHGKYEVSLVKNLYKFKINIYYKIF